MISNANSMDSSAGQLSSVNVNALNKYIDTSASTTLSDTSSGSAANYKLPPNDYDSVKNNLTITAAPLTISADDQSKTYGDADPTLTVNYSGDAVGFDPSHVSGWSISAPTNASATAGTHSITVDVSAATADNDNYTFATPTSGTLTVNKRPITLKAQDQSKIYGDALSLGTSAFDLTAGSYASYSSGIHASEAATAVTLTSANGYDASTTQNQATYSDEIVIQDGSVTGDNFDINNYLITRDEGDLTINKREVTLSVTKSYDGTDIVETSELTIGNRANGETLSTTGVLNANSKNVDGSNFLITTTNFLANGTGLASNYQLPSSSYVSGVNSVTTTPAALTITADNQSKTYGDSEPAFTVSYSEFQESEDASVISGLVINSPTGASATAGSHSITLSGATANNGNYNITYSPGTLTVNERAISLAASDQSKVYGEVDSLGTTAFNLVSGSFAYDEEATNVVLTTGVGAYESTSTTNAATYTDAIAISDATGTGGFLESNYNIDYREGDYTVQKAPLTIAADNKSKIYGSTEPVLTATYTGFKNDENPSVLSDLVFSAPTGSSADAGSHVISPSGATAGNYDISFTDGVLTVNKATLNVTALNGSKFVTENDSAGFEGVSYSGFVLGESESDAGLLGGTLDITRSNSDVNLAGDYENVLNPSGLTASNYEFNYISGDYTINPSDQLVVRFSNVINSYGTPTGYSISSVEYNNGSSIVRLDDGSVSGSSVTINSENQVVIQDGSGGSATFNVGALGASYSSTGNLEKGTYSLSSFDESKVNGQNFSDQILVTGSHQVEAKPITATVATGLSKIYDSSQNMLGLSLSINGVESGDSVNISGSGLYATKNTGSELSYTVSDILLDGLDAHNYILPTDYSISNSNGQISPKTVSISASKIYDAGVDLAGYVSIVTGVGSETLTYSGATSSSKDVAVSGKYIDAIILEDAMDGSGGLASNYQLPVLDASNAPVTIGAKTVGLSASRIYDGSKVLSGDDVLITTGVGTETLSYSGAVSSSKDVAVSDKYIESITLEDALDGTGGLASNYELPGLDVSNAPVTISTKEVSLSASRIYDGSEVLSGDDVLITTGVGTETLSYSEATSSSKDVAVSGKYIDAITLEDALDGTGGLASNYHLPSLDSSAAPVVISPKTVSLSASKIYDAGVDLAGYVSLLTGVGSETLTYSGATSSSKDVAVSGKYIDAITLEDAMDGSGGLASNYQLPVLDASNAPVTIGAKTVGLSASRIYDGSKVLSGDDVLITTGVGTETLSYSGAVSSSKDVAVSDKYIESITLEDALDGTGGLASNYELPGLDVSNAPVTISTKEVSLSASRIYDGSEVLSGDDVLITTGVGTETLSYSGATSSSKDVAVSGKYIDAITLEDALDGTGGLASNYHLPSFDSLNAPVVISPKTVGLSASKIYDAGVDLAGYVSLLTGVGSETLTYSGATSSSKDVAVSGKYIDAITLEDAMDGSGGLASNYQLPVLDASNAPVTIGAKTVGLSASRIYDGSKVLSGDDVLITTGVGTETLSYSGAVSSSKDVAVSDKYIESITLEDALDGTGGLASNYELPGLDVSNAPVTISTKEVSLSASRIYDGSEVLSGDDVLITTGVGTETLSYSGATSSSKDVAVSGKYIDAITLEDALDETGGLASNYHLPSLDSLKHRW